MNLRWALAPLGGLYSACVEAKNWMYDRQLLASQKLKTPVVSFGNLTFGGTGKTPIISNLLEWCRSQELKVAVISKSYKTKIKRPTLVNLSSKIYFGDEPMWLSKEHPEVDVFVGPNKTETAFFAESQRPYDLLIVDDGFQHRRLSRNLDIVVMDAMAPVWHYQAFPRGWAREGKRSLQRAKLVMLTRVNLANRDQLDLVRKMIPGNCRLASWQYTISELRDLCSNFTFKPGETKGERIVVASGIGQPKSFEELLVRSGFEIAHSIRYDDHHFYSQQEISDLQGAMDSFGASKIVVTEKDAVKIRPLIDTKLQFFETKLKLVAEPDFVGWKEVLSWISN